MKRRAEIARGPHGAHRGKAERAREGLLARRGVEPASDTRLIQADQAGTAQLRTRLAAGESHDAGILEYTLFFFGLAQSAVMPRHGQPALLRPSHGHSRVAENGRHGTTLLGLRPSGGGRERGIQSPGIKYGREISAVN